MLPDIHASTTQPADSRPNGSRPPMLPEIRARISAALKGCKKSAATRAKMSAWQKGRTLSQERRKQISEANMGRVRTPESRAKTSAALKGVTFSAEHRRRLSEARLRRVSISKGVSP